MLLSENSFSITLLKDHKKLQQLTTFRQFNFTNTVVKIKWLKHKCDKLTSWHTQLINLKKLPIILFCL